VSLASWLFIRGSESIWIERPFGFTLIIAGPGSRSEQRDFRDDKELDAFQVALAERLAAEGWFLWAHDVDRRSGTDRRGTPRSTSDRRRLATVIPIRPREKT
jgi:hypothetical protein